MDSREGLLVTYQARDKLLLEVSDLIEQRLVKTAAYARLPLEQLTDFQRGLSVAIREVQQLLREEARKDAMSRFFTRAGN